LAAGWGLCYMVGGWVSRWLGAWVLQRASSAAQGILLLSAANEGTGRMCIGCDTVGLGRALLVLLRVTIICCSVCAAAHAPTPVLLDATAALMLRRSRGKMLFSGLAPLTHT
jgi:hypothetical protein